MTFGLLALSWHAVMYYWLSFGKRYKSNPEDTRLLDLQDLIGSLQPGREAELMVLNLRAKPLLELCMNKRRNLGERLVAKYILGGEREVDASCILGQEAHGCE